MKFRFSKASVIIIAVILCFASACVTTAYAAELDPSRIASVGSDSQTAYGTENDSFPDSYSSAELGYVTPVKSQSYNDCWAYGSLGVFESALLKNGVSSGNMSPNHMNLWATKRSDSTGWQRNPFEAGFTEIATGYFTSWQGAVSEDEAGEIALSYASKGDSALTNLARFGVTGIEYISAGDTAAVKRAIMNNGGVFASYGTTPECLSNNKTAYYMPPSYSGSYMGHSIEIVGWDDNYSKSRFDAISSVRPQSNGAWLIKNSSGSYNPIGGYLWISYEDKLLLKDKTYINFTINSFEEITPKVRLEQNEIFGATYEFTYLQEEKSTFVNKFDFSNGHNTLDKVVFATRCSGAEYTVSYVPANARGTLEADPEKWKKLGSGTVPYSGYVCADISDFSLPLGYGGIAVCIDTSAVNEGISQTDNGFVKSSIGVGEWLRNSQTKQYIFLNASKREQSYIFKNGEFVDLMDWYRDNNNDSIGGTFVIKAVTIGEGASISLLGDVDLDSTVMISDVTMIQKYLAQSTELSEVRKLNADFNNDSIITIEDGTAIQEYLTR